MSVFSCGCQKAHSRGYGEHYHRFPCPDCSEDEVETEVAVIQAKRYLKELQRLKWKTT